MHTKTNNLYLVVMAGGSGTRFWPKSTSRRPKQLLSFVPGGESLLIETLKRFDGLVSPHNRMVVTTRKLAGAIKDQVNPEVTIMAEPQGRNTAPCIYWAAREIREKNPNATMLVMPADHCIKNPEAFSKTVSEASRWVREHDDLVTLGVKPTRPETGYGYLKVGEVINGNCRKVAAFVEKPDTEKAAHFFQSGEYLWNGGMFIWRVDTILKAFDFHMPLMRKAWDAAEGNIDKAYSTVPVTSIDYGVMESASNVVTFPLDCGWDDMGSWISLEGLADTLKARFEGGVVTGGELLSIESSGNIVDAPAKVVALLGIKDLIIVEHGDVIMVAHKDKAQDIRRLVEQAGKLRPELI